MDKKKIDLALYTIDLKIVKFLKDNKESDYEEMQKELSKLREEKEEIYKNNEEVINKVLDQYLKEVQE